MLPYQGLILEHFRTPRNYGELEGAEAIGDAVNPLCGDVVQLFLAIDSGRIARVGFVASACAICVASTSVFGERIRGVAIDEVLALTTEDLVQELGTTIPHARHACAGLVLRAFRSAVGVVTESGETSRGVPIDGAGVAAIILAAGAGSRFGGGKLGALLRGEPVIRRSVRTVIGAVSQVVVVVPAGGGARGGGSGVSGASSVNGVSALLAGMDVRIVENANAERGMSTSIVAGIEAVPDAAAVLITLGDQPFLPPQAPRAVCSAWRRGKASIVVPRYRGVAGHPVLFERSLFGELAELSGDAGARAVIDRDPFRVASVDVDATLPRDVDTRADLVALGEDELEKGG